MKCRKITLIKVIVENGSAKNFFAKYVMKQPQSLAFNWRGT